MELWDKPVEDKQFKKVIIMKLFNSYLEMKILVEEAIRKFVITESEYDEIMRVAKKDGKIDARKKKLLSKLKEVLGNGSLIKIPDRSNTNAKR